MRRNEGRKDEMGKSYAVRKDERGKICDWRKDERGKGW